MTLIEAIKSGRLIRMGGIISAVYINPDSYSFNKNEILSDDWEIEEDKVTVSYSQALSAFQSNSSDEFMYSLGFEVPKVEENKLELTEIQVEDAVYNNQNYHGVVDVEGLLKSLGFKVD